MTIDTIDKFGTGSTDGHDQAKWVWFVGTKRKEAVVEFLTLSKPASGNKPLMRSDGAVSTARRSVQR